TKQVSQWYLSFKISCVQSAIGLHVVSPSRSLPPPAPPLTSVIASAKILIEAASTPRPGVGVKSLSTPLRTTGSSRIGAANIQSASLIFGGEGSARRSSSASITRPVRVVHLPVSSNSPTALT